MASNDSHLIAERYARALFELAAQTSALEAVENDLNALLPLVAEGVLDRVLANPLLPRARKAQALEAVLTRGKAHALTRKFIGTLAENNRLAAIATIIHRFNDMLLEHRGEAMVEVQSANALSDAEYRALSDALSKSTGKKVRLRAGVDASLLGGLTLEFGGKLIDYSLASRLSRLRQTLKMTA